MVRSRCWREEKDPKTHWVLMKLTSPLGKWKVKAKPGKLSTEHSWRQELFPDTQ